MEYMKNEISQSIPWRSIKFDSYTLILLRKQKADVERHIRYKQCAIYNGIQAAIHAGFTNVYIQGDNKILIQVAQEDILSS